LRRPQARPRRPVECAQQSQVRSRKRVRILECPHGHVLGRPLADTGDGEQRLAEQIVEAAGKAGVPLYPDPELAMVLSQIPLGEEIPDNLYKAIAEVIAFAYILAGKFPEGFVPPNGAGSDTSD
jgi:flagellar biosynthesis protein